MSLKIKASLLTSLVLHGIIALLFFFRTTETLDLTEDSGVQIEVLEKEPMSAKPSDGGKKGWQKLKMKDLLPGYGVPISAFSNSGVGGDSNDPRSDWGSGGGEFERIKDYVFLSHVRNEVEGLLFYPQILARHGISGTINSRVHLAAGNGCDWKHTSVSGGHPYLKVYVTALLKKLCAMEVAKRSIEPLNVDMSFTFEITERSEDLVPRHQQVVGNVLVFNRNFGESVTEWKLGPVRGSWLVPVINIDFPWIFENWDRYFNGRDPFDEFKRSG